DDLGALVAAERARAGVAPEAGDVIAVASKLVSRAEGRFVDLAAVVPSPRARALALRVVKDPRHVEVVLREASAVSRAAPRGLIVRHRLGFVVANAGVDLSNAAPPPGARGAGPWAVLLPVDPDASAAHLADALGCAVVITDSFGRPFRRGTVGVAIGAA